MKKHYDAIIIGSGLIGITAAIALAQKSSWHIALIDTRKISITHKKNLDILDTRTLALNYASIDYLKELEIWDTLADKANPINQVHISEQGACGSCLLSAHDVGYPFLGQVVEIQHLQEALLKNLHTYPNIDIIDEAHVSELSEQQNTWQLTLEQYQKIHSLTARSVFLCDGSNSKLRQQLAIRCETHDYQQSAIVAVANCTQAHHDKAYERFAGEYTLAILPMQQQRVGTVLTTPHQENQALMQLTEGAYLEKLQSLFGYRLGRFTAIGPRQHYPLQLLIADRLAFNRLVLLGNTAHTFNPVGAQGLNLGLAGVRDCIETLLQNQDLFGFEARQRARCERLKKFTHQTVKLFSNNTLLTRLACQLALIGLQHSTSKKRQFIRQMMGLCDVR